MYKKILFLIALFIGTSTSAMMYPFQNNKGEGRIYYTGVIRASFYTSDGYTIHLYYDKENKKDCIAWSEEGNHIINIHRKECSSHTDSVKPESLFTLIEEIKRSPHKTEFQPSKYAIRNLVNKTEWTREVSVTEVAEVINARTN